MFNSKLYKTTKVKQFSQKIENNTIFCKPFSKAQNIYLPLPTELIN